MRILGLFLVLGTSAVALVQDAPQEPKMDVLLVYGENFLFRVKEPDGWVGDTSDEVTERKVNVVFFPKDPVSRSHYVNIRIRINRKSDENTQKDLNFDIAGYQKRHADLGLEDLPVRHPEWKTYPKLLFVKDQFYEYVAYLNPGPGTRWMFSVAMSKTGERATEAEFAAFEKILKSIRLQSSPDFKVIGDQK